MLASKKALAKKKHYQCLLTKKKKISMLASKKKKKAILNSTNLSCNTTQAPYHAQTLHFNSSIHVS